MSLHGAPPDVDHGAPGEELTLRHDAEAERAVLGAALLNPAALETAGGIVKVEDFFRPAHRVIWRALRAVASTREPTLLAVRDELENTGKIDAAGGVAYLSDLDSAIHRSADVEWWAARVRDLAVRRAIMHLGGAIVKTAANGVSNAELALAVDEWREQLGALAPGNRGVKVEDLANVVGRPIPAVPWVIPGLVAEGDIVLMSGAGGIGKTWLALSFALSLASGLPLFGKHDVKRPYRVAILDLESRPWETDARLSRLANGLNFVAKNARGHVQIIRERLRLDRPEDVARLVSSLRAWETEFLVVDSFRRMTSGDVNKAEVVAALFADVLDRIRLDLGCGSLVNDHTRKRTGEADLDAADQALIGTVDKRNMADAHFGIEAREERLAFVPTKTRHARLPEPILLEIDGLDDDPESTEPVEVRCVGSLDRASDRVQDAIVALLNDAGEAGMLRGEIIGRSGYSKRAVADALSALCHRGRATKRREKQHVRYFLADASRVQGVQTSARRVWEPK